MITEADLKEAIVGCKNLTLVAQGFGITVTSLMVYMEQYGIKPEKLIEDDRAKQEKKKPKPYIHPADDKGVRCVLHCYENKTAKSCIYGGLCGTMDCCDYMILTGHRRPIVDPLDTHYCTAYVAIDKKLKEKMVRKKTEDEKRKFLREYLAERNKNVRENT